MILTESDEAGSAILSPIGDAGFPVRYEKERERERERARDNGEYMGRERRGGGGGGSRKRTKDVIEAQLVKT